MTAERWTFFGRIHPERAAVTLAGLPVMTILSFGQSLDPLLGASIDGHAPTLDLEISWGQVVAEVALPAPMPVLDMRNMVLEAVQQVVDGVGWEVGCAYQVEISAARGPGGSVVFDVVIPQLLAAERIDETRRLLPWLLTEDCRPLRRALADVRQAGMSPGDTPFYCFRAVESLAYFFGRNPAQGTPRLCAALRIDRAWLRATLEIPAGAIRHGQVLPVSDLARERATSAAVAVLVRFITLRRRRLEQLPDAEFPILGAASHDPEPGAVPA